MFLLVMCFPLFFPTLMFHNSMPSVLAVSLHDHMGLCWSNQVKEFYIIYGGHDTAALLPAGLMWSFLIASKLALELCTYDTVLLGNYYEHCSSGELDRTSMHYELMNQAHDAVLQSKTLFTLDRILEDELKRSPGTCIGLLFKLDKSLAFFLSSKLQPPSLTLLS